MTNATDAEFFRYNRLFGVTEDGLQMKVTVITNGEGKVKSASIQMRAIEGDLPPTAHPSLWSTPFPLTPSIIGDDEFGGAA